MGKRVPYDDAIGPICAVTVSMQYLFTLLVENDLPITVELCAISSLPTWYG